MTQNKKDLKTPLRKFEISYANCLFDDCLCLLHAFSESKSVASRKQQTPHLHVASSVSSASSFKLNRSFRVVIASQLRAQTAREIAAILRSQLQFVTFKPALRFPSLKHRLLLQPKAVNTVWFSRELGFVMQRRNVKENEFCY
jgi:hypothetical protein